MRLIDADILKKAKFHPLPYTHIVPQDTDAESYKRGWNDAIDAIAENEPTVSAEPEWIPCGKRLPESDERVLVYTVANEYHVWDAMPHRGEGYEWDDEEGLYHNLYEVEKWMPLPTPY